MEKKNVSMAEADIWSSYRNGNEQSFRKLYDHYYAGLLGYGSRFTKDHQAIEESIQDLFIKLWRNRASIGPTPSVKFYLYKSFRRVLARKLRYLPETAALPGQEDTLLFNFEIGQDEVLIKKEHIAELKQQLEAAMATMTDRQREVIYLKYYEDLSHGEISDLLGITSKATYKLVYRALDHLREHMALLTFLLLMGR